jgi:hypothetical protein
MVALPFSQDCDQESLDVCHERELAELEGGAPQGRPLTSAPTNSLESGALQRQPPTPIPIKSTGFAPPMPQPAPAETSQGQAAPCAHVVFIPISCVWW